MTKLKAMSLGMMMMNKKTNVVSELKNPIIKNPIGDDLHGVDLINSVIRDARGLTDIVEINKAITSARAFQSEELLFHERPNRTQAALKIDNAAIDVAAEIDFVANVWSRIPKLTKEERCSGVALGVCQLLESGYNDGLPVPPMRLVIADGDLKADQDDLKILHPYTQDYYIDGEVLTEDDKLSEALITIRRNRGIS